MTRKYLIAAVCIITSFFLYFTNKDNINLLTCRLNDSPNQRLDCLIPYFKNLTNKTSAAKAVETARQFQKEGIVDDCHLVAHIVGAENLKKNDFDPGKAFATCTEACIEGCYHGVMEEYMKITGDTFDPNRLSQLCKSISDNPLLNRQCIHGIGHGILRHNSIDLSEAMRLCLNFADDFSQTTCLGGLFMQNVQNIFSDTDIALIDLGSICDTVQEFNNEIIKQKCIESIGGGLMFYTGHDLEKSKELCLKLKNQDQNQCIKAAELELEVNRSEIVD